MPPRHLDPSAVYKRYANGSALPKPKPGVWGAEGGPRNGQFLNSNRVAMVSPSTTLSIGAQCWFAAALPWFEPPAAPA
jgi:hypothetical protein